MHESPLIDMANRIGSFFEYQGDRETAMRSIASHLSLFWAPSMRRDFYRQIDAGQADDLAPLVQACASQYRDELLRSGSAVPGQLRDTQPAGGGDAG